MKAQHPVILIAVFLRNWAEGVTASWSLTADSLVIQPRFPFNLMFLPEIYGLEYKIIGLNIRSVQKTGRFFGKV